MPFSDLNKTAITISCQRSNILYFTVLSNIVPGPTINSSKIDKLNLKLTPFDRFLMVLSTAIRTEPQSMIEFNQWGGAKKDYDTLTQM